MENIKIVAKFNKKVYWEILRNAILTITIIGITIIVTLAVAWSCLDSDGYYKIKFIYISINLAVAILTVLFIFGVALKLKKIFKHDFISEGVSRYLIDNRGISKYTDEYNQYFVSYKDISKVSQGKNLILINTVIGETFYISKIGIDNMLLDKFNEIIKKYVSYDKLSMRLITKGFLIGILEGGLL